MDNRAIGVFDSGLGGLTAVKRILELAPHEDIIFFGDNARVPYGNRGTSTITRFALEDISLLLGHHVKMIIAACGTVSSTLSDLYTRQVPLPFMNVVTPTAAAAAAISKNRKIGIIGTKATIYSEAFPRALQKIDADILPVSQACPLFVPLVESGYIESTNEVTHLVAADYLSPLKQAGVDVVILGCTHYPIIQEIIQNIMGSHVTLVDSGTETARSALALLDMYDARNEQGGGVEYYVSDNPTGFRSLAELFLGEQLTGNVHLISLDDLCINQCFRSYFQNSEIKD